MVSVIIPNYNHAIFLEQRIESVLSQTYADYEVIILDDCSTDHSRDIIEKYRGNNKVATILYNEVNTGNTFKQWVKGIELSKGKYIWIAESDDWCEATFMEEIMSGLLQDESCVVGYCQSYCIDGTNSIRWQSSYSSLSSYITGDRFINNYMLAGTAIFNASMAIWKKDSYSLISNEFLNYRFCGDWLFWIELSRHGNVFISGKLLNYFRKHENDVSSKAGIDGVNFIEELKMFHLLYKRKWISYEGLVKGLKSEYVQFKVVERILTRAKRIQIRNLFFAEAGTRLNLQLFYMGFYSKYVARKLFNKVIS